MKRTALRFYVEGQYVTQSAYRLRNHASGFTDPADQDWTPFTNTDIHPFGKPSFTAWSQFSNLTEKHIQEMTEQIVQVINWLYQERNWVLFDATLWLDRGKDKKPRRMFRWELC